MSSNSPVSEDDQGIITFRDLVVELVAIGKYVLRHWYIVALAVIAIGGGMYWYAASQTPNYVAALTFTVRGSDEGSGGGGGGSVLAQLGLGGGRSSSGMNLERLEAIAKSRSIITDVLFSQAAIAGDTDYVANHLLDVYEYRTTVWKDNEQLASFPGFSKRPQNNEDLLQNSILKSLTSLLTAGDESAVTFLFDPITTIHKISVSTPNDELSGQMVEIVYRVLDRFYVNNAVQKQREIVQRLQLRADSTQQLVLQNEGALAARQDRARDVILRTSEVGKNQLQRQLQINTTIYLEIIKNLEIARYTLNNITPSFQVIDSPVFPLPRQTVSKVMFTVIGVMIGLIVSITLLILWRAVRNALRVAD